MLQIHGFVLHLDRFFDRNDMHTDTGTALRYKRRDLLQRQTGHMLKKCTHLRIRR